MLQFDSRSFRSTTVNHKTKNGRPHWVDTETTSINSFTMDKPTSKMSLSFQEILGKNLSDFQKYLAENSDDIYDRTDSVGNTILHYAVKKFSVNVRSQWIRLVQFKVLDSIQIDQTSASKIKLLYRYVNIEKKNNVGQSAADVMFEKGIYAPMIAIPPRVAWVQEDLVDGMITKKILEDGGLYKLFQNSLWFVAKRVLEQHDLDISATLPEGDSYLLMAMKRHAPFKVIRLLITEDVVNRADDKGVLPLDLALSAPCRPVNPDKVCEICAERNQVFKALFEANIQIPAKKSRSSIMLYFNQFDVSGIDVFGMLMEKCVSHIPCEAMLSVLLEVIAKLLRMNQRRHPLLQQVIYNILLHTIFPKWITLKLIPVHTFFILMESDNQLCFENEEPFHSVVVNYLDVIFLAKIFRLAGSPKFVGLTLHHNANRTLHKHYREEVLSLTDMTMEVIRRHMKPLTEDKLKATGLPPGLVQITMDTLKDTCATKAKAICDELKAYS